MVSREGEEEGEVANRMQKGRAREKEMEQGEEERRGKRDPIFLVIRSFQGGGRREEGDF